MRTWLITGCATGFGALLAQTLLDRGEQVVATDRNENDLEHLHTEAPERLLRFQLDVTNDEQITQAVAATVGHFGRIDLLVNNAGLGMGGPFEETPLARIRQLFAVNTLGMMALTQAVLPQLRAQGGGRIINISSDSGVVGWRFQSVYCATKHAVEGFSEALAHEVTPFGIQVVLIEPCGFFRTPMPAGAVADVAAGLRSDSPYNSKVAAMLAQAQATMGEASDPRLVVEAILAAADDPAPLLRRPVGPPERVQLLRMRQDMPDEQFVQFIRSNT